MGLITLHFTGTYIRLMDIGKALLFLINIEGLGPRFSSLVIYLGHKQDISCVTEA